MRAVEILQNHLDRSLADVHKKRRDAVCRAVQGLLAGGMLWLTALGRALPGASSDKHRIKAVDRLLGKEALQRQIPLFYKALAARLLRRAKAPVILIDWSALASKHYMLSAQVACDGRSLPLHNRVYPKSKLGNRQVQLEFLHELASILPNGRRPIIITDAGFRSPWFDAVSAMGWDFIGRIRNTTKVSTDHGWLAVARLHQLAGRGAKDLGRVRMRRMNPREYRLVLSAMPKIKGRKRTTRRGGIGRNKTDSQCSKGAREPWVLATSLSCSSVAIVGAYSTRMQIEESFRDAKNHRHGWSLRHARSDSAARLEVLLLIASLAFLAVQLVGRAVVLSGLHRQFQANTVMHRRVLSFFVLGRHALRRQLDITRAALLACMTQVIEIIALNGALII